MSVCQEHDTFSVMVPLDYPAVGSEPVMVSVRCELEQSHDGEHRASNVLAPGDSVEWAGVANSQSVPRP